MKLVAAFVISTAIVLSAGSADAKTSKKVDPCEVARCAVQASINSSCPCNGAGHGAFFKCVSKKMKQLVAAGSIPKSCVSKALLCASKSSCGRPKYVICNIPIAGCRVLPTTASCGFAGGVVVPGATTCCASCSAP